MTHWDAEKFDGPATWDQWIDVLGQAYGAGDVIVYASISGRSPQLVIAEVLQINRVNSKGQELTTEVWDTADRRYASDAKRIEVPTCTVRVKPLLNARGFHRSIDRKTNEHRAVTLTIPENILKVPDAPMP